MNKEQFDFALIFPVLPAPHARREIGGYRYYLLIVYHRKIAILMNHLDTERGR